MINANEIVSVTKADLLSLYSTILLQASGNSGLAKLVVADGIAKLATNNGIVLADIPVDQVDFDVTTSSVSAGTVYFMAGNGYKGVSKDGTLVTAGDGSVAVVADGSLYKAVLSSGTVTVTRVGF